MKLRWKITILCGLLLALLVMALSQVMYDRLRDQTYQVHMEALKAELQRVETAFTEQAERKLPGAQTPEQRKVLLRRLFQQQVSGEAYLRLDGALIYGSASELLIDLSYDPPSGVRNAGYGGSRTYALCAGTLSIDGRDGKYQIYLTEDLTQEAEQMAQLYHGFLKNAAITLVVGVLLLAWILSRALKPLGTLQKTAAHIADGAYGERAPVKRKDEVGLLAADFNRMAQAVQTHIDQLTEQNKAQQRFLRAVTHEFKTPMTSLQLNVETMRTVRLPEDRQAEILADVDDQLQFLEKLVQKLLKLLTLKETPDQGPIDKEALAERTRSLCRGVLEKWGIGLEIQRDDALLVGDEDLLCSALCNLVENAAKASQAGSTVHLRLLGSTLEVEDQGVGIPAEAISKLTEPFYTADPSRSKQRGGFGLGLSLVKAIADAHGGILEIESTLGMGTLVRLRLPEKEETQ